ncbi:RNA polymerase sigma factor [Cumulibacter soli]|uniref:RNA polymerase sigma factor n=1 Tax=Cumulibacter soli TaxID=2546344 RepID=UPI0010681764|nr:sigma-70 family RNA polymerase sigma factor [Cumulibacter soli]
MSQVDIDAVFRSEYGRAVSVLTGVLGDITLAEDAVQAAFEKAVRRWPDDGWPPSPAGWIITTARREAIDRIRREAKRADKEAAAPVIADDLDQSAIADDRLRMFFTCAHPSLAPANQAALILRVLGGLSTADIGRAFLTSETTIAARVTRAKAKIRDARIPYRVPDDAELPERVDGVLRAIYLIFTEGYRAAAGDDAVRDDLATEAIRLARVLVELMPDEPECVGLLALLLLTQSRRDARVVDGELVPLDEQDRTLWDLAFIAEGHQLVRHCLRRNMPGSYQLQAAIAAVHAEAERFSDTDWTQVVALYDQLIAVAPGAPTWVARAVAIGERDGAAAGIEALDELPPDRVLEQYAVYHAARASMLRRLRRYDEAVTAYDAAIGLTANAAERRSLARRRDGAGERAPC